MKIGIFVNCQKDKQDLNLNIVKNVLISKGIDYSVFKSICDDSFISEDFLNGVSLVLVLGGDGTMLHATREIAQSGIPIFGINIGNLGFLTEIEVGEFEKAIDLIIHKKYFIEERLLLSAMVDTGKESFMGVNDVYVVTEKQGKLVDLDVYVNQDYVNRYVGDGIIVASPTGSTGYSLSCGGPIVSPKSKCLILTPICAHSLTAKPMILSEDDEVCIKVNKDGLGLMIIDGQRKIHLLRNRVCVKANKIKAKYIRLNDYNFFDVLYKKLTNSVK